MNFSTDYFRKNLIELQEMAPVGKGQFSDLIDIDKDHFRRLNDGERPYSGLSLGKLINILNVVKIPLEILLSFNFWIIKYKLVQVVAALQNNVLILEEWLKDISEDDIKYKDNEKKTSIYDHLTRLEQEQEFFYAQLKRFKSEERPGYKEFFKEKLPSLKISPKTARELVESIKQWRVSQLELLNTMDERDFLKKGRHSKYKKYTLPFLLKYIYSNDLEYIYKIFKPLNMTKQKLYP